MNFWSLQSCPYPTRSERLRSMKGEDLYVGFAKGRGRDSEETASSTWALGDLCSAMLSELA